MNGKKSDANLHLNQQQFAYSSNDWNLSILQLDNRCNWLLHLLSIFTIPVLVVGKLSLRPRLQFHGADFVDYC